MSRHAPPRRTVDPQYADRMDRWFTGHPVQWETLVNNGLARFELELQFEAWCEAHRRADAARMQPPAGRPVFGPPPAEPSPRSIWRDLFTLTRKALRW